MRIDYKTLKSIKKWYGSDDFEIGAAGKVRDGRDDYKFVEPEITLRFGYWFRVDLEELTHIIPFRFEVIEDEVDESEFGQPLYHYVLRTK